MASTALIVWLTRAHYSGALIGSDSYTAEAETSIGDGLVDAVSFGRLYIANPDLVERFKRGGASNEMDKRTIYGGEVPRDIAITPCFRVMHKSQSTSNVTLLRASKDSFAHADGCASHRFDVGGSQ